MALVSETKKGGPYTKKEQEKRRSEVYKLHFEYGYSAVKISNLMKVNRNTINDDIKYWYSQLSAQWQEQDPKSLIMKQIQRFDSQRCRLFEDLEKEQRVVNKLVIEKLLFDVDSKLTQIFTKIEPHHNSGSTDRSEDINEAEAKKSLSGLIKKEKSGLGARPFYYKDEILFEIIKETKRDQKYSDAVFDKMMELGLGACEDKTKISFRGWPFYFQRFCLMRGYLTEKDVLNAKVDVNLHSNSP